MGPVTDDNRRSLFYGALKHLGAGLLAMVLVPAVGIGGFWLSESPYVLFLGWFATFGGLLFLLRRQAVAVLTFGLAGLAIAMIPLFTTTKSPKLHAEGEQLLGSMIERVRAAQTRSGDPSKIRKLTGSLEEGGCGVNPDELQGKFFRVVDEVSVTQTGATLRAEALPANKEWGTCTYTFAWEGGNGEFTWNQP